MKKLCAVALCLASFSFTLHASTTTYYKGHGTWERKSDGMKGTYSQKLVKVEESNLVHLTEYIFVERQLTSYSYSFHKLNDTFYDVYNNDHQVIGSGYCFPIATGKVCHTRMGNYESTVRISDNGNDIFVMGSKWEDHSRSQNSEIAWQGTLTKTTDPL